MNDREQLKEDQRAARLIEKLYFPNRRWRERSKTRAWLFLALALALVGATLTIFEHRVLTILGWFASGYLALLAVLEWRSTKRPTYREHAAEIRPKLSASAYVLYLRSFGQTANYYWGPEEMALSQALAPAVRVVAIEEPGLEGDAPAWLGGASRLPVRSAMSWQQEVKSLMQGALFVVIRAADTPGVLWEISEAQRLVPPERLVLFTSMSADYEVLRRACDPYLRVSLPVSRPKWSHFIEFDESWVPRFTASRPNSVTRGMYAVEGGYKIMRCELSSLFVRFGLPVGVPVTNNPVLGALAVGVFWLLVVGGWIGIIWAFFFAPN